MWAIMGVAVNPRGAREWAAVVIGGALGFGVSCIGTAHRRGLNPARAFGPALVGDFGAVGEFVVIYMLGPIVGALLAGVRLHGARPRPQGGRRAAAGRHAR